MQVCFFNEIVWRLFGWLANWFCLLICLVLCVCSGGCFGGGGGGGYVWFALFCLASWFLFWSCHAQRQINISHKQQELQHYSRRRLSTTKLDSHPKKLRALRCQNPPSNTRRHSTKQPGLEWQGSFTNRYQCSGKEIKTSIASPGLARLQTQIAPTTEQRGSPSAISTLPILSIHHRCL